MGGQPQIRSGPRVICSSLTFRHLGLGEALEAIAAAGFAEVELAGMPGYCGHWEAGPPGGGGLTRIAAALAASGLRLAALQTALDGRAAGDAADVSAAITAACVLGAPAVHCGVPREPAPDGSAAWEDALGATALGLRSLAEACAGRGVRLCIEAPHNRSMVRDAGQARRLIEAVGHPAARLTLDTAHHHKAGWAMERVVDLLGAHVGHVHLRDQDRSGRSCQLGTGDIDFAGLHRALAIRGYDGAFSIEMPEAAGIAAGASACASASRLAFLEIARAGVAPGRR